MEDYRLEHQKNTAASILHQPALLSLYAHKQGLSLAVARYRLLQVKKRSERWRDGRRNGFSPGLLGLPWAYRPSCAFPHSQLATPLTTSTS